MKRKICLLMIFTLMSISIVACGKKNKKDVNNSTEYEYADEEDYEEIYDEYYEDSEEIELLSFEDTRDWENTFDSSVCISYEIVDDTIDMYEFESAPDYIGDYKEGPAFLISFDEEVTDLILWELSSSIDNSGNLEIYEQEGVDYIDDLPAYRGVYIKPGDVGETLPFKGISMVDSNGLDHHFYLQISGEDGSAIVNEYDFSYINIDGFDVDDDRYPAAHLKGFDTMQSAVEYYEDENTDDVPEWSVLWVVVPRIDADGTDENGNKVHDAVEMTQEEIDFYSNEMSEMFESEVEELSLSHVDIVKDVFVYDKAITRLDYENDVSPECFDEETRKKFKDYNSVICCVKLSDGENQIYNCDWLGLGYGVLDKSYGFCEVRTDVTYYFDIDPDNTYPAEPWIHEWQHTLQPLGTMCGRVVADPDEGEAHGYKNEDTGLPINGFWKYYADTISGSIDNNVGITPGMWRAFSDLFSQTRGR